LEGERERERERERGRERDKEAAINKDRKGNKQQIKKGALSTV
jgi:hypothetical protein